MTTTKAAAETFDSRMVRKLADILNQTGLTEIEVEREGLKIRVARTVTHSTMAYAPPPSLATPTATLQASPVAVAPSPATDEAGETVKSPMVGTVYLQSQPGSPAFIRLGDTVSEGQTLLLVEAMKTMNPIASPRAGTVLRILVTDAQPVEYGEPLIVLA